MKKVLSSLFVVAFATVLGVLSPVNAFADPGFDYYMLPVADCNMDIMVPHSNATNGNWYADSLYPITHDYGFTDGVSLNQQTTFFDQVKGVYFRCMDFSGTTKELFQTFRATLRNEYPYVTAVRTNILTTFDAGITVWELQIDNGFKVNKAFLFTHNGKGYMFEMQRGSELNINQMIAKVTRATQF